MFTLSGYAGDHWGGFDVAEDGRFLVRVWNSDAPAREIEVIENWTSLLIDGDEG